MATGFCRMGFAFLAAGLLGLAANSIQAAEADSARGEQVYRAAGCQGCHTQEGEGQPLLAGGRALATPFGTFYSPNITPDRETGIGEWSQADFERALRQGEAPDGRPYYPAFPYTSYSGMNDQDLADLWAYLRSQPAVALANRDHALDFPFSWRWLTRIWRWLFFDPAPFQPEPAGDAVWNRGAYLVRHLGHCGECHSPRNFLGAIDEDLPLAGNPSGPDGKKVPSITARSLSDWSEADLADLLDYGLTPDGDVMAGAMREVIKHGTAHISDADRLAIARYLKTSPP